MTRSRRRRRTSLQLEARIAAEQAVETATDKQWMVVVRESAKNLTAFVLMLYKVTANLRYFDVPGLEEARALGATVFTDESVRAELEVEELRRPGARPGAAPYGYAFKINGTWFVFAQISARATSVVDQDNHFTRDLVRLVRRERPTHLGSGPTSRLCRHRDHVSSLNKALVNLGGKTTKVVVDESEGHALNLRVKTDKDRWDDACTAAEAEYHAGRKRLASGIAAVLALGQYSHSEDSLPATYVMDPDCFDVSPDPGLRAFAVEVLKVSARSYLKEAGQDPRREWAIAIEKVIEVADKHGWTSAELKRKHGAEVKFSDARYPERNVERLWSYFNLWATGIYEVRQELDLGLGEHLQEFNGARLERVTDPDGATRTFMVATLDFGTYEWTPAERALLEKAIERRSPGKRPKGVGGRKKGQTLASTPIYPLLGLCEFIEGDWQYKLTGGHNAYHVFRRPARDATYEDGTRRGWKSGEGENIATIQSAALHAMVATAAVMLIDEGGVAPTLVRLPLSVSSSTVDPLAEHKANVAALEAKLDTKIKRASVVRTQETDARVADQIEAAEDYKKQALEIDQEVRTLRRDLVALIAAEPAILPAGTTADPGQVAVTLAALAGTESKASLILHEALVLVLANLRVEPGVSSVRVSFSLRLPTSNGAVTLGPTAFDMPNTRKINKKARVEEMLDLFFVEGLSWPEIGAQVNRGTQLAYDQTRKHLVEAFPQLSSGGRTGIMQCPIADTRRIVWHGLTGADCLPQHDEAWLGHVPAVYLGDVAPRKHWDADTHTIRRDVLDYLLSLDDPDEGALLREISRATGHEVVRITTLAKPVRSTSGLDYQPSYEPVDLSEWAAKRVTPAARIRVRMCPWCSTRTASHVLRIPECPADLLCTTCRRMPTNSYIVFPEEYMKRWVGGSGFYLPGGDDIAPTVTHLTVAALNSLKLRRSRAA